jgi:DNA replication protein DnaC
MRNVIQYHGQAGVWVNGMDLFGRIRDRIQRGEEERDLIRGLVKPDVLAISDPLPPFGALTEFQATMLFRVLDERYSRRRPVWVTVNVANRAEFEERMGVQLVDRLIDGALVVYCNWKSYREVRKRT